MTTSIGELYTDITNLGFDTLKDPDALGLALEEFDRHVEETGEEPESLFIEQRDAWEPSGFHPRREVSKEKLLYDLNDETEDLVMQAVDANVLSREEAAPFLLKLGVDVDPEWMMEGQDPTSMTPEALDAYYKKLDGLRSEYAQRHRVEDEMRLRSGISPQAKAALDEAGGGYETGFTEGVSDWYDDEHGWLMKGAYAVGLPQQAAFRHAVLAMDKLNLMDSGQARQILSQKDVRFGDILNVYWSSPESRNEFLLREGIGLVGDIFLDPAWMLSLNKLTKAGKTATVAGHTIDLSKAGRTERAYVRALEDIDQILIDASNNLKGKRGFGKKSIEHQRQVMEALAKDPAIYSLEDIKKALKLKNPKVSKDLAEAYRKGITVGPWWREMAKDWEMGYRQAGTAYVGIPFTNIAKEIPLFPSKATGKGINHLADALGAKTQALSNSKMGQQIQKTWDGLWTKTNFPLFDDALRNYLGSRRAGEMAASDSSNEYLSLLWKAKEDLGPDDFKVLLDDLSVDFERRMIADEAVELSNNYVAKINGEEVSFYELLRRLKEMRSIYNADALKKVMDQPIPVFERASKYPDKPPKSYLINYHRLEDIFGATDVDKLRMDRLSKHPELMNKLDSLKKENLAMVMEYRARGIPFDPLNVFSSSGVGRYVKHTLSREYLDVTRKASQAGEDVQKAMDFLSSLPETGKYISGSEKGRAYRGSISLANQLTENTLGTKMFVTDPAELHYRRMMEMDRTIRNYDLMDTAKEYAVVGKAPGPGYVKFNPDDFRTLAFKDDLNQVWDQYVPDFYKSGDSIYIPEQIYDRMLFTINGQWATPQPIVELLKTTDPFMKIWRNNMLFGLGYQGQNAFSNLFTMVSFHGPQIINGAAKATKLAISRAPFEVAKRNAVTITLNGVKRKSDDVWRMALEDNIIAAGFRHEMDFYDLAQNISSTLPLRGIRNEWFGSPGKTFETIMLWRANRWLAQLNDDIPKLSIYLDRLDKGFSRVAAREAAERYFYAYNVTGKSQSVLRSAFPFSTFPIKTAEMVGDTLTSGERGVLAKMSIGPKVGSVLNGLYVQDPEMRDAFNSMTPDFYKKAVDPIFGELLPGRNQVMIEMPWAISTMGMLTDPPKHPVIQAYEIVSGTYFGGPTAQDMMSPQAEKRFISLGMQFIPPVIREPLTIMDIRDNDFGGVFAERYAPTMPGITDLDKTPFPGSAIPGTRDLIEMMSSEELYEYASNKIIDKYGPDFLYDVIVGGKRLDEIEDQGLRSKQKATAGNYIKSKFRQFSMGLASLKPLDRSFFIHAGSINAQIRKYQDKIQPKANEMVRLYDPDVVGSKKHMEFLEKRAEVDDDARNLLTLMKYREVLLATYTWASLGQEKLPNGRLEEIFFGYNPNQIPNLERDRDKIHEKIKKEEVDQLIQELMLEEKPLIIPPEGE